MLKERVLTAVIGLPVVLVLLYFGGIPFTALIFVMSEIALHEYAKCTGTGKSAVFYVCAVFDALQFLLIGPMGIRAPLLCAVFCLIVSGSVTVFFYGKVKPEDTMVLLFGFLYVCVLMAVIAMLRNRDCGFYYLVFALIAAWGSDTFAYIAGRAIGKHKMTPALSPKKTWEGFAGGLFGAGALAVVFALIFRSKLTLIPAPVFSTAVITFAAALFGVAGDLFASAIKRHYGVKDYGNIFPGHGGVMDRTDSLLFTAGFLYFAFELLEMLK